MSLLYLNACCITYLLEASSPFHAKVVQRLATGILEKADVFLTGDQQLQRCTEIQVEVIT